MSLFSELSLLLCLIASGLAKERCSELLDARTMTKEYLTDNFLISSLTAQLLNRRKLNKYLNNKLKEYRKEVNEVCVPPEWKKMEIDKKINCRKQVLYESCEEAITKNNGRNGIYLIKIPLLNIKPLQIFCAKSDNSGWLRILHRLDNSTTFNRSYETYVLGFGDLNNNFFLGLDNIYKITHNLKYELKIELVDKSNILREARYSHFAIGGPEKYYSLYVLGKYKGNLSDALRLNAGSKFSCHGTNNEGLESCTSTGGWWFSGDTCGKSHLNSQYEFLYWDRWANQVGDLNINRVSMQIREIDKRFTY